MLDVLDIDLPVLHRLHDGPGRDAIGLIILHLQRTPAGDLLHGPVDGPGHNIGIEDHVRVDVPCRPADDLDQGPLVPQEPLLVRVQDADEPHLRDVQALPEQVDPHQHVELPEPELPDDLGPLDGLDLGVEVPGLDPLLGEVLGQLLGQALGEGHDERPVAPFDGLLALGDDVHRLPLDGPGQDHGFQEARGPDDLLGGPPILSLSSR